MAPRLEANPKVNFTIVINPANGPENTTALDSSWKTTLERLNKLPNTRPIGYINTELGLRSIGEVLAEATEYATWSYPDANGTYGLTGVYYDRVAANRTTEGAISYGILLDWMVKTGPGFSPRHIVHYPPFTLPPKIGANFFGPIGCPQYWHNPILLRQLNRHYRRLRRHVCAI